MLKQEVFLEVYDRPTGGNLILDATGLRTDFDIRLIPDFSRATFTIFNLSNTVITNLMSGDRYVTLKTQLHGGKIFTLANRFYVNNAVDELVLPNRITKLYCYDILRKEVLETQVNEKAEDTSLQGMIRQMLSVSGQSVKTDFLSFPAGLDKEAGLRPSRPLQGNIQQCIRRLETEYNFRTFTIDGGLTFMYMPDLSNVDKTTLASKKPDIVLNTTSMRSNPKIGIASATINSNLDGRIKPSSVLDLSELITIGTNVNEESLQLNPAYLKNFTSYSKYQAFAVVHVGSTHTKDWSTKVTALSPTKGKLMSTISWANTN